MRVIRLGLTGGIGSGKSTVSKALAALGAVVVDADVVAREVVERGTPGLAAVVEAFGEQVLQPDGTLDREALGKVVFGDDEARKRLSGILHPLIGARSAELWAAAEQGGAAVLVHDVPLLVESKLEGMYDEVLVVDVPPEVQLDRLVRLRGMAREDAEQRIAAQATREVRLASATRVLHNDGTVAQLEAQVRVLWDEVTA
jgi:dephospho-CoA kinase